MSPSVAALLLTTLLAGALVPEPARAGEPTLHVADLVAEARRQNPELQAARDRARAMAFVPDQASALDDPTLSYEAWNIPDSLRVDRADNNIFRIAQKLPFPGKRRLAGEVAAHEAEQGAHQADGVEIDLVAAVKQAYWDLWQAHERLAVLERDKALLERFAHVAEQRYGVGDATQGDVLRAQVELTHLVNRLQIEPLAIEAARAELNTLLGHRPDEPLGVPERPPAPRLEVSVAALADLALEKRPDLAAQAAAIAREESAEQLAHRSYYPDFEVSVGRFVNYGQSDGFGAMASVTLPFVNGGKYDAGVEEARAKLSAARAERRRLEDRTRREVQQTYLKARAALLQYELFSGTHVPHAEQALRVAESAYETSALGFLDLVDTLRRVQEVHLDHVEAQGTFERAWAELERVVGVELPRSGAADAAGAPAGREATHG